MESFAERLYVEFAPFLRAYCYTLTREEQSAQDLAQEVLLKALMHLSDLENLSPPQLRAWLCTAARNAFADTLRRQLLARGKEQIAPESAEEEGFALAEVYALLALLPPKDSI